MKCLFPSRKLCVLSHATPDCALLPNSPLPEDTDSLVMDVGVDSHDFRPWHFDEIAARMREHRPQLSAEPDDSTTDS